MCEKNSQVDLCFLLLDCFIWSTIVFLINLKFNMSNKHSDGVILDTTTSDTNDLVTPTNLIDFVKLSIFFWAKLGLIMGTTTAATIVGIVAVPVGFAVCIATMPQLFQK